jgi:hypothetical protein
MAILQTHEVPETVAQAAERVKKPLLRQARMAQGALKRIRNQVAQHGRGALVAALGDQGDAVIQAYRLLRDFADYVNETTTEDL